MTDVKCLSEDTVDRITVAKLPVERLIAYCFIMQLWCAFTHGLPCVGHRSQDGHLEFNKFRRIAGLSRTFSY